ncbi:MAG: hypothetical protein R8P61_16870 [Bacteroidia bacterium]|nr:hypothetical protein [Bacteroidia bacterium]
MTIYRGFIIWIVAIALILGAFLLFVQLGWPGQASDCIYKSPNGCFCESFDIAEVSSGAPGVRQPVNTWFNLYSLLSSFIVAFYVYADRRDLAGSPPPNQMRSHSWLPELYIFAVLFLGLGSMWFHASLTQWGNFIDGVSMYVFAAFLASYSLRRIWESDTAFWIIYSLSLVLFSILHLFIPSFINILILVVAYFGVEIYIWLHTGKVMQGKSKTIWLWSLSIFSILVATFFWWASHSGNFLCDPDSFFQPHGLIWHPLAGVSAVLLYFYWRDAEDV